MADKALNKNTTAGASLRRRRQAEEPEVENVELEADDVPAGAITPKKDRATPSQRHEDENDKKGGNIITRTVRGLGEYFEGVRSELRKVAWPTREETRRLTIIVLVALIVSSLVLGAISLLFTELFRIGLDSPIVLFLVMIIGVGAGVIYNRLHTRRTTSY